MFFGAFLGDERQVPAWRLVVHSHADWLGLSENFESRRLPCGLTFAWESLTAPLVQERISYSETDETLVMTTGSRSGSAAALPETEAAWDRLVTSPQTNAVFVRVLTRTGVVTVFVPATAPEQFYFGTDARGQVFASDLRLMLSWFGLDLDERAVYGLFQYGRIPPPFSVSKRVQRVPSGHVLTVGWSGTQPRFSPCPPIPSAVSVEVSAADPQALTCETLEHVLAAVPNPAVVYFSGGVDSTLLAARLAAVGRTDVKLLNYSWGDADERAKLALEMAAHLGIACEQVVYDPADLAPVLDRFGRDYSFPFGGRSVIPTNLMVHAGEALLGAHAAALEGTGADGAFGLGPKRHRWERVYRMPAMLRRLVGAGYKWAGAWRYESRSERLGALGRRSAQMRLDYAAVLAQNSLDGIAYATPPGVRADLDDAITTYTFGLGEGLSVEDRYALLDMVSVCAGEFAAKCFDPLRRMGVQAVFPFLEPPMLRMAWSLPWEEKCRHGEEKGLLKALLARSLPREWVYLPKEGFIPPFNAMLAHETMQGFLRDIVLSPANPLLAFCRPRAVQAMVERTAKGRGISVGAQKFLWTLMFASGWLAQLER